MVDVLKALEGFAVPLFVCPQGGHEEFPTDVMDEFGILCDIRGATFSEAVDRLRRLRPDAIVTFTDHQLDLTSRLAAELGLPFTSSPVVETLTRKSLQRRRLNVCGASHVASHTVESKRALLDAMQDIDGPAVLKPDVGTGSRSTYRLTGEEDAVMAARELFPADARAVPHERFVLEEEIPGGRMEGPWGDYVSVESAVLEDDIRHVAVLGKFPLAWPYRETGSFLPAALPQETQEAVTAVASVALRGLGVRRGIYHTEVKLSVSGPQVIEVNGRLGGRANDLVQMAGGPDLIRMAVRLALSDAGALDDAASWTPATLPFLYAKVLPPSAKRFLGVDGADHLRARPEISRVIIDHAPGASLDWRKGRLGNAYVCFGAVRDHRELERLLGEIERTVTVRHTD
ncbi:ATP-grasp domain-containing protein [Streptomyces sp. NPDC006967]|uniref:ATP-grasp domain-containing protein n=1 Tax=Streptomyces sp. NPDC006967 TaxID=3156906 RepID=UPI0033E4CA1C